MRSIFSRPDAKATMSERRNEYWLEENMICPLWAKEASGAGMSRGREQPIFRCMEALGLPLVGLTRAMVAGRSKRPEPGKTPAL